MKLLRCCLLSIFLFCSAIGFLACPNPLSLPEQKIDSQSPLFRYSPTTYFSPQTEKLQLHLFYEPNALPETGNPLESDCWDILRNQIKQLTKEEGVGPDLYIGEASPSTFVQLSHFHKMEALQKKGWTPYDLYQLASEKEALFPNDNPLEPAFYIFFVNGLLLNQKGKPLSSVLALSLSITLINSEGIKESRPTPIIALFKDAIRFHALSFSLLPNSLAHYEQITLAHEMGHSFGLVNMEGGIPAITPHEDSKHPHHCRNEQCLMYWANESLHLFNPLHLNPHTFCNECIDDLRHFRASLQNP